MKIVKQNLQKYILIFIGIILILALLQGNANAETGEIYTSMLIDTESENTDRVTRIQNVTNEMTKSSYWKNRIYNANDVIMTKQEISELNQAIVDGAGTNVFDLTKISATKTQNEIAQSLAQEETPTRDLYINGNKIDNATYFTKLKNAITETGFNSEEKTQYYAVVVKRADLKAWPIDDVIGYSAEDPDDEMESTALNVNEPFVIRAKCTLDGQTYYWGYSETCSGWLNAKNVALFDSKEEWINAWQVDINAKDFLVVTQDKITLEPSILVPETSEVKLMIGTVLKLVPTNEIPETIGERGTYYNYVVYLPTRDENGKYIKKYALISEHYNVSIGYLPMTQANILDVAFSCLGNRYGWGGMLDSMDCSAYTQSIYKCFGLLIPRNTTWQQKTPGKVTDISQLEDTQKEKYLEKIQVGSLLYFPGHTMVYIGNVDGVSYVISDTGSFVEETGELNAKNAYSVIINPLTVRRKNGRTWLNNVTAVLSMNPVQLSKRFGNEKIIDNNTYITSVLQLSDDIITGKDIKNYYTNAENITINNNTITDDYIIKTGDILNIDGTNKTIVVYGDTDSNGKISIMDAVTALNCVKGKKELTQAQMEAGKVCGNEKIGILDAVKILNVVKGKLDYSEIL